MMWQNPHTGTEKHKKNGFEVSGATCRVARQKMFSRSIKWLVKNAAAAPPADQQKKKKKSSLYVQISNTIHMCACIRV